MIGVTGIIGVLPEGGTVGADATLQAMLEGLAKSAGGVKTYADLLHSLLLKQLVIISLLILWDILKI